MTRAADVVGHWLGLCRKAPVFPALQEVRSGPAEFSHEGLPDGRDGGPGSIRRGVGSALSGMKTLNRNRQLLWFTLLAGLVMAITTICQGALCYIGWIMADETVLRLALNFAVEFLTVFCMVVLLAGLVLSIASKKEGAASFIAGLSETKHYSGTLIIWSLVLALAGMILNRLFFYPGGLIWPVYSALTSVLTQYPFTLHLNPSTFAEIPGYGGRSELFWTYPYGFENALGFFAINLLLLILTLFVIPLVVLRQKSLRDAVSGSFALMKNSWVEVSSCAVFLGLIVSGVFLTYLIVQAAHGMATPPQILYDRPTSLWLAIGTLWYLALFSVTFVMVTAGGIASLDLYRHAQEKECPP